MKFVNRYPVRRPAGTERAGAGGGPRRRGLFRIADVREAKRRAALRLMAKGSAAREAGAFATADKADEDDGDGAADPDGDGSRVPLAMAI